MAGDLLDNRGRGDVRWSWPPIHPEGRKFGAVAVLVSLVFLIDKAHELVLQLGKNGIGKKKRKCFFQRPFIY